ncbi:MAG: 16S rRNA (cytidine(1402)-2'-O)-methyltransferase [Flavobacteriales bacterium]|nr:MAG: 16S rRNA (cytidine(1402)-2'-O)-methyltransferase [Flavobacteriales bacterium]
MGKLFVVPTPIGNLEDISLRALRILKEVHVVLAEDTRTSGVLLKHYEINTPLRSYHMHNEHHSVSKLVEEMQGGIVMGLVSDAGMPGISDPGFLLIRESIKAGIEVEVLPGANAALVALVESGLPCDRFVFEGFLPVKKGRKTRLEFLQNEQRSVVFYESPHRILRTLKDLSEYFGESRQASMSRELSKKFHETRRGSLAELIDSCEKNPPKGEIVLVLGAL